MDDFTGSTRVWVNRPYPVYSSTFSKQKGMETTAQFA